MVVEVLSGTTMAWVVWEGGAVVVGVMVVGAEVAAADRAGIAAALVALSRLLVRARAHPIPATVARTTSTSGTISRRSCNPDRACWPARR
jgi:hypothetical protein